MIVDDQDLMRRSIRRELRNRKSLVIEDFASPADALRRHVDLPFDIAILDVQMPEMSGIELAPHLMLANPGINIVYITGDETALSRAVRSGHEALLKPWESESLRNIVDRFCGQLQS